MNSWCILISLIGVYSLERIGSHSQPMDRGVLDVDSAPGGRPADDRVHVEDKVLPDGEIILPTGDIILENGEIVLANSNNLMEDGGWNAIPYSIPRNKSTLDTNFIPTTNESFGVVVEDSAPDKGGRPADDGVQVEEEYDDDEEEEYEVGHEVVEVAENGNILYANGWIYYKDEDAILRNPGILMKEGFWNGIPYRIPFNVNGPLYLPYFFP